MQAAGERALQEQSVPASTGATAMPAALAARCMSSVRTVVSGMAVLMAVTAVRGSGATSRWSTEASLPRCRVARTTRPSMVAWMPWLRAMLRARGSSGSGRVCRSGSASRTQSMPHRV
ncbi:hypothetical protein O3I_029575 [Nocardia brasiliensis ATCC 700358]|uniref:Uncharacterized protein n=1 Tax=Nocardia brasiliensis (strain ATCC 700358 / HUJEG-1) TaxID=1133849 RepID=K0F327_NOCB7|nr:hypothetical protein O3I_029575 [Nocardia brasiliensis ATCC 700358]